MTSALLDGMIAGAAGSAALNAAGYLDMVLRARPASSTPHQTAQRLADTAHIDLGPPEHATHRRSGLGPLLGYGLGVGAAAAFTLLTRKHRPSLPTAVGLLGATVMAVSGGTMTALGVTDPRHWRPSDWWADILPHLAYGLAAAGTWNRLRPPAQTGR